MASKLFPHNMGPVDRMLRVIVGLVLIGFVFTGPKTPWGLIGLVPLLTSLSGTCPAYTLFGWSTCKTKES